MVSGESSGGSDVASGRAAATEGVKAEAEVRDALVESPWSRARGSHHHEEAGAQGHHRPFRHPAPSTPKAYKGRLSNPVRRKLLGAKSRSRRWMPSSEQHEQQCAPAAAPPRRAWWKHSSGHSIEDFVVGAAREITIPLTPRPVSVSRVASTELLTRCVSDMSRQTTMADEACGSAGLAAWKAVRSFDSISHIGGCSGCGMLTPKSSPRPVDCLGGGTLPAAAPDAAGQEAAAASGSPEDRRRPSLPPLSAKASPAPLWLSPRSPQTKSPAGSAAGSTTGSRLRRPWGDPSSGRADVVKRSTSKESAEVEGVLFWDAPAEASLSTSARRPVSPSTRQGGRRWLSSLRQQDSPVDPAQAMLAELERRRAQQQQDAPSVPSTPGVMASGLELELDESDPQQQAALRLAARYRNPQQTLADQQAAWRRQHDALMERRAAFKSKKSAMLMAEERLSSKQSMSQHAKAKKNWKAGGLTSKPSVAGWGAWFQTQATEDSLLEEESFKSVSESMKDNDPPTPKKHTTRPSTPEKAASAAVEYNQAVALAREHNLPLEQVKSHYELFKKFARQEGRVPYPALQDLLRQICGQQRGDHEQEPPVHLLKEAWMRPVPPGCTPGSVDFEEFLLWVNSIQYAEEVLVNDAKERSLRKLARQHRLNLPDVEIVKKVFASFDVDGSGHIEEEEFKKLLFTLLNVQDASHMPGKKLQRFWRELDEDGSGEVTFEEFLVWYYRRSGLVDDGR
eukprot:TRINITY_DN29541_c0_g1_i1.p1 TRINITY_DN29541_c0_g1~~TRINITY_DN29541_c0_g1_i1.p1  ORF type:complete len:736 (+),score=178.16 TRINITY_DN29541_c0_g1_i1:128-2335(+)